MGPRYGNSLSGNGSADAGESEAGRARTGLLTLSKEVLPDYAGDYIVLSTDPNGDRSLLKSDIWKSIPAVKNRHVIEINAKASSYSDLITLEYLLDIFKKGFLGQKRPQRQCYFDCK